MVLEEITRKYEYPILGIIGATVPSEDYPEDETVELGYRLRELIQENNGTLFTGGVSGVGLDFYRGVIDYCKRNGVDDKFFCLFPNFDGTEVNPPEEYYELANEINKQLSVERFGRDMEQRRMAVGPVADSLVLVNGSSGTLDEAIRSLAYEKSLITLKNSGGAADIILDIKEGRLPRPDFPLNLDLIQPAKSIDEIVDYLSSLYFNKQGVNQ
ncbi:Uncharacterised protein [uncultured archaeon]|nr:Uncharacterised protein [uncultured archaeon]